MFLFEIQSVCRSRVLCGFCLLWNLYKFGVSISFCLFTIPISFEIYWNRLCYLFTFCLAKQSIVNARKEHISWQRKQVCIIFKQETHQGSRENISPFHLVWGCWKIAFTFQLHHTTALCKVGWSLWQLSLIGLPGLAAYALMHICSCSKKETVKVVDSVFFKQGRTRSQTFEIEESVYSF